MLRLSVIVPALNEAAVLAGALAPLQRLRRDGHEVVVVDGGSRDATRAVATPLADRVLASEPGRARQMNVGAAQARGEILLFLHADTRVAGDALDRVLTALSGSHRRWGRFDVAIEGRSRLLPIVAACMNARSRLTGIATGDQGMFVERALFEAVGGFPELPLMEDVELSRRLKRAAGPPLCLTPRLVTSGRRWDRDGAWRTIALMWRLRFDRWRGVDPGRLAARYDRPSRSRRTAPTLQIFAKEPVPGAVKTRLARSIGAEAAAQVYAELVARCLAAAAEAKRRGAVARVELWCAPAADGPLCRSWAAQHGFALYAQGEGDLGTRMRAAMRCALARGERVLLVGTDCPTLDANVIANAAAVLTGHDAVLVPAEDGGYVAIGLARDADVFSGIAWSTSRVAAATRERFAAAGLRWWELPPLADVDSASDLARWRATGNAAGPTHAATGPPPR